MSLSPYLATAALVLLLPGEPAARAEQVLFGVPERQLDGLEDPVGACFDEDGVLHVVERRAGRVSRFGADGARLGTWGEATLSWPSGIACEGGELYVLDAGHGRILVASHEGAIRAAAGEPGSGSGQLHDPRAIAARDGEVLVADSGNDRLLLLQRDESGLSFRLRLGPFAEPCGVAFLEDGSLAVADSQADRLVRLDAADFGERAWGTRGEAPGLFSRPTGLAVDGGRLYSVDTENHRVQVFDAEGSWLGLWGRHAWLPHEGEGKLHYPSVVAVDGARDRAVVCEPYEDRCQLFTRGAEPPDPARDRLTRRVDRSSHYGRRLSASGRLVALTEMDGTSVSLMDLPREQPILVHRIGRPGRGHGLFRDAVAAIFEPPRRIVVADSGARRIATFEHELDLAAETRFDPRLTRLVREIDLSLLDIRPPIRPVALAPAPGGELFVLDAAGSRVVRLDRDGNLRHAIGGFGEGPGELRFPTELSVDEAGTRLLVVDSGNHRVQLFDRDGRLVELWGGPGRGEGEFVEAFGACFDRQGRIFVTDRGSNRVQRFDAEGHFQLQWGDEDAAAPAARRLGAGQLHRPAGIAQAGDGRLLVVDHGHHRGQIFTTDGEFLKAFGARLYTRPARSPRSAEEEGADGP